jgi:hypothetical protein
MAQDIVFEIDSLCYGNNNKNNSTNRHCSDAIHSRPQRYSFHSLRIDNVALDHSLSVQPRYLTKPLVMSWSGNSRASQHVSCSTSRRRRPVYWLGRRESKRIESIAGRDADLCFTPACICWRGARCGWLGCEVLKDTSSQGIVWWALAIIVRGRRGGGNAVRTSKSLERQYWRGCVLTSLNK